MKQRAMSAPGARSLAHTLAWAGDGAAHLRGLMTGMGEDASAAPSALPGWSRAHVLTHVARNADAVTSATDTGVGAKPARASARLAACGSRTKWPIWSRKISPPAGICRSASAAVARSSATACSVLSRLLFRRLW